MSPSSARITLAVGPATYTVEAALERDGDYPGHSWLELTDYRVTRDGDDSTIDELIAAYADAQDVSERLAETSIDEALRRSAARGDCRPEVM